MNYQEFRDLWHEALQAAHLHIPYPIGPTERINLRDMSRTYEVIIHGGPHPKCEPFHIATSIEWHWDSILAARYATTEEDMLMELFGDFGIHDDDTVPSQLRMDVCLSASTPYGTIFPMPETARWQPWISETINQLHTILPTLYDEERLICAFSGDLQATIKCQDDGRLSLEKVTFEAWQAIVLPRQWDDPQKEDPYPDKALLDFAYRISKATTTWENILVYLVNGKT